MINEYIVNRKKSLFTCSKKVFSSDKFFVPLFGSILVWVLFFSTTKLLIISNFTK